MVYKLDFYKNYIISLWGSCLNFIYSKNKYLFRNNELYFVLNYKIYLLDNWVVFFLFLKNNTYMQFKVLNDICIIDWVNCSKNRFELVYNMYSFLYNLNFFFKIFSNMNSFISISTFFNNAGWIEREAWDLFGLFFYYNKDLRRILTDYGFTGYPFRKDFPLTGYVELRYSDEMQNLIYEPVELSQNYRIFLQTSPWEIL
jgi:NADH:ubiquinone oxidoreductase subunit C